MSCKILFLLLLASFGASVGNLFGSGRSPEEIWVSLEKEDKLPPIYLSEIEPVQDSFPLSYLKELEKVIKYDFEHNGKTSIEEHLPEKEKQLRRLDFSSFSSRNLLFLSLKNKHLCVKLYDKETRGAKSFPDVVLTGSLAEDRRKIHALSDAVHKVLFSTEGIASSKILYAFQKKDTSGEWVSEIVECDWDGENMRPLTKEGSYSINPVVLPKGDGFTKDLFFYVSYKTGQPKIFIRDKERGESRRAVDLRGNQMLPAVSRQRDKLAFVSDAAGRTDLFIQSIKPETGRTGKPEQLFSYPRSSQGSPTFNPDGSKIAFVSDKDGSPRIYVISTESKGTRPEARMITKKNKENTCPCWSPDGTKLAYSAKTEGTRQIWIYDFIRGEEEQLTYGAGNKENPCWAPNGLHLVFNSTDDNYSDLYVLNLRRPIAVKITKGPGKKHYPAWGPK